MYMICLYYSIVYWVFIHVYTLYIHVYTCLSGGGRIPDATGKMLMGTIIDILYRYVPVRHVTQAAA